MTKSVLILSLCLMSAAALAGCISDDTGGGGGGTDNRTGGDGGNGGGTPLAPYNGTETIAGAPQASRDITITVNPGYDTVAVTFAVQGSTPLPTGQVIQGFQASLKDPNGTEVGTSTAPGTGISGTGPAGDWVLSVAFNSVPVNSVEVTWEVSA